VDKFIKVFAYTGYLDWFKDERDDNEAILISCPSNICGIVYTDKVRERCVNDTGWNSYMYNGFRPAKKVTNYVLFEGQFYSCDFVLKTFNKFFKDKFNFEIRILSVPENDYYCMFVKINSVFSIGVANLKDIVIKDEGDRVAFIDVEWIGEGENQKQVECGRHYREWKNGKAVYECTYYGKPWKKVVYNQDYLFTKQEDVGDSLLI